MFQHEACIWPGVVDAGKRLSRRYLGGDRHGEWTGQRSWWLIPCE